MSFYDNNKDLWAKQLTSNSNNNSNHNNNANFHHHEVNYDGNTAASIGALFGGGGGSVGSGTLYNHLNNMNSNNYNFYQQQLMNNDNNWQVVPDSLDHLSRDELCRMIYRLDYERNTLQDSLMRNEQLLMMMQQQLYNDSRSCRQRNDDDMSTVRKKGKKRTRFAFDYNNDCGEEEGVEQLGADKEDEEELIVQ